MATKLRALSTIVVGMLLIAVLITTYTAQQSLATHEPAMKSAVAGSDLDEIGPDGEKVILKDTIRVSTAQDLVLSVTSECSILTSLITGDDEQQGPEGFHTDRAFAFGQVEIRVELDGKPVPVSADDPLGPDVNNDPGETPDGNERGEVVFCNRAYQRTVQDRDALSAADEGFFEDEIEVERDYIRTRMANAFNWLAGNVGDEQTNCRAVDVSQYCFDNLANGNNIIEVVVYAEYDTTPSGHTGGATDTGGGGSSGCPIAPSTEKTCAEAYVGSRTLIVEPVHIAIHEMAGRTDGIGN